MTYRFSATGRSALRKTIVAHPDWPAMRAEYGIQDASGLTKALLNEIGGRMGLDLPAFAAMTDDCAPVADPAPAPADSNAAAQLATLIAQLAGGGAVNEARVLELIAQHAGKPSTVDLHVYRAPDSAPEIDSEALIHRAFPLLLSAVAAGVNVMLVGPAGSGKTTAAERVAHMLQLPFYFTGAIDSAFKLSGFIDAQGRIVSTAFRRAYEHGGVFLFDEIDGSLPSATLAFNAALANGHADFPDGMIERHPNFRAIAAANTYGNGASREYVGRNQQDAAALDRYATLAWDYDERLESAMLGQPAPKDAPEPVSVHPLAADKLPEISASWLAYIRNARRAVDRLKLRHIVSPRAAQHGVKLLMAGWPRETVIRACVVKGLDADSAAKLSAAIIDGLEG